MLKKISLYDVEQEIYSKRQTIRYDIRDLTVESIVNKYEDSLESDDTELAKKKYNYIYIPEYQRDFTWDRRSSIKTNRIYYSWTSNSIYFCCRKQR